ncbi:MAG: metallophosphoesterase family protein [Methylococcales bacterium]|nr:metallophosphoesterase family protein [Methylococcales bacterium]
MPTTLSTIELIGAIDGHHHYQAGDISALLLVEQQTLTVGTAFTGRPGTRIFANDLNVVKIRAELDLGIVKARLWADNMLQQERQLAVHHPHKTWFIVNDPQQSLVLVGSITPRLKPLNIELKSAPQSSKERQRYLAFLAEMFRQYLQLAKSTDHKLDEGLSNFALDGQGHVYYLDDEYYTWDSFATFSVMLGVFIRNYDWLTKPFVARLARQLGQLIDEIFIDPHYRIVVCTQLQSLFMPSEHKEQLLRCLIASLSRPSVVAAVHPANKKNLNARKNNSNRYYAIMADIHANDAALECVLDFYRENHITQGIVLGDIVGYGPEPQRCIELLQASSFEIIKGNHDHAVATNNTGRGFSSNAKIVIDWTIGQLSAEHKHWLNSLPAFSHNRHWLAVHGAPIDPGFFYGYVYQLTAEENLDYLQQKNIGLCFHGHSHMPGIFARDVHHRDHHLTNPIVDLNNYDHLLVCPGSVGQPRNNVPRAQCAIYDREKRVIEFINLAYPLDAVVEKMQRHGLPDTLWQRLLTGK